MSSRDQLNGTGQGGRAIGFQQILKRRCFSGNQFVEFYFSKGWKKVFERIAVVEADQGFDIVVPRNGVAQNRVERGPVQTLGVDDDAVKIK